MKKSRPKSKSKSKVKEHKCVWRSGDSDYRLYCRCKICNRTKTKTKSGWVYH